ncbi:MAG: OsmC family protein [Ignavibacteriota bacterium]
MNSQELREIQAPLKSKYRDNADAALVTLRASATLGRDLTSILETPHGKIVSGPHPATGGSGKDACSGDMLLEAVAACAGVTMNSVATVLNIELRNATIIAEGDLDFRGTLGVSKDVPVGFKNIRLRFHIDTDATEEQVASLIKLTERYCVVFQTLKNTPELTVALV